MTAKTITKRQMSRRSFLICLQFTNSEYSFINSVYINSAGSTQACDSYTCDDCMPQCIRERDELFTQTQAHIRIPMSNQCAWTYERWTWITSSGSTGRLQVKRDPKGTWKSRLGLELAFRGDSLGTKPKGCNNDTVEMCRSNWKRSFGSVTKGAQWLQERTVVREKPQTGMDTISSDSMALTDATN